VSDLGSVLDTWLAGHADGIACVIGDPTFPPPPRVRSLTPELSKGLEFDLVVLIDPEAFGTGIEGAVDRYVAMTRATQQLVILTSSPGAATQPSAGCAVLGVERVSVAGGVHRAGRGDRT
jgi:hypothetical protein